MEGQFGKPDGKLHHYVYDADDRQPEEGSRRARMGGRLLDRQERAGLTRRRASRSS